MTAVFRGHAHVPAERLKFLFAQDIHAPPAADELNVPAELSMDEHMCCGVGVCLTCVIPIKTDNGWEYQRTCTEGPVFDSRQIAWDH